MRKKRVLLLSEGFGSGHTQAAYAISVGLRKLSGKIMTKVLELGAFQHPTIFSWVFRAYRKTVTSQPRLYGMLYRSKSKKSLSRLSSLALHRLFYSRTANIISQLRPDVIVTTHPFPNAVVSRLKRSGLTVPLCAVITDYDAHGTWVDEAVNIYLVSTEDVRLKLIARGVTADKIRVTGIPVHPNFWGRKDKATAREQLGLKQMPTVLIMGGGWGIVGSTDLLRHAAQWRDKVQLIICLGNNRKFLAQLSDDPLFQHPHISLFGYTKQVDKLMDVSDVLITKPGGMTCTEAIAKGIPMLFYSPIPGQEEENRQYFIENGFAEPINSPATIDEWFTRLVQMESAAGLQRHFPQQDNLLYNPEDCPQEIIRFLQ